MEPHRCVWCCCSWRNTSWLVLFDMARHAFSITVSLNWRDLRQKIVQSSVSPVHFWKLSYYRARALRWGDKKKRKHSVWGKRPLKMDLVEVQGKHIAKPGVHWGNNSSLNNNHHVLLNMAERWQGFLKELAEWPCLRDRGARCVFRSTKGGPCSINRDLQ